jgi:hypothetical protein
MELPIGAVETEVLPEPGGLYQDLGADLAQQATSPRMLA